MKNYLYFLRLSAAMLIILSTNFSLPGQTLLIENFSYSESSSLTSNGWIAHSGEGTNPVKVYSSGLTFPGYASSNIGLSAILNNTGEDVNKSFVTVTSGTVFCALLVKVNTTDNEYFFHLAGSTVGTNYKGRIYTDGSGTTFNFGLSKGTGNTVYTSGSQFSTGVTYLVVLKYAIVEGALNDIVSLFILSGSVPATEPSTPSIGPLTDGGQSDLTNVGAVVLRQNSALQNIIVDGIRVAQRWEDAVGALTINTVLKKNTTPVLYPVPVANELTVSYSGNIKIIEIFDISGRKVKSIDADLTNIVRIPVNDINPGLYFLRLYTSAGIEVTRFVKK
jgi:hypothetical protein